jgi:hypothetical protein
MTRDVFWQLVDATRPTGIWAALHAGTLELRLQTLPEEEIVSFERHFNELMAESYRWDLWGAASIVNGGGSDDGFAYFRAWLISQGRRFFEKCLANPDAVAARADRDGENEDEEFMHAAAEAFREKTGRDLPPLDVAQPREPAGPRWHDGDLPSLFPRLAKKFRLSLPE